MDKWQCWVDVALDVWTLLWIQNLKRRENSELLIMKDMLKEFWKNLQIAIRQKDCIWYRMIVIALDFLELVSIWIGAVIYIELWLYWKPDRVRITVLLLSWHMMVMIWRCGFINRIWFPRKTIEPDFWHGLFDMIWIPCIWIYWYSLVTEMIELHMCLMTAYGHRTFLSFLLRQCALIIKRISRE